METVPSESTLKEHKHTYVQRAVSSYREKSTLRVLLDRSDTQATARILSASTTGAGAFLTALPTRGDLQMSRSEMLAAVRWRLGLPMPVMCSLIGTTCACGTRLEDTDICGNHLINCKHAGGAGWGKRSRFVQLKTRDIAIDAGLTASLEQVVGSERDRTDVTIHDWIQRDDEGAAETWQDGRIKKVEMHVDVAVVDATAATYVKRSAKLRGSAARARGARKIKKYKHQVAPARFTPGIVETHGLLDHGFVKLLNHTAECHIDLSQPGLDLSETMRNIIKSGLMSKYYKLISVALQKGLAANFEIARRRAATAHARQLDAWQTRGLTLCRAQGIIGDHLRLEANTSQLVF